MTSSDGQFPSKEIPKTRFATQADIPHIEAMAKRFFDYSPYRDTRYDDQAIRDLIENLIDDENSCMFVNSKGFICGSLHPLLFAPSLFVASEIAWWSEDGVGTELREVFEAWARNETDASAIQLSTLNNSKSSELGAHLVSKGYAPVEVHYLKAID